jgi:Ca2+-binding EF-hand superfamily protein
VLPPRRAEDRIRALRLPGQFTRLDADGNGAVDAADLKELMSPARSSVRGGAVIAALDTNGDGKLDPGEFVAAFEED